MEVAVFGAGCFWGVEEAFRTLPGVLKTEVGYTGGRTENPTYREVCSHTTGHAEVVRVEFDPEKVSYDQLLDIFWAEHDPTQLNRQGPDIGDQYRSVIFYQSPEQAAAAQASLEKHRDDYRKPVVTQIVPAVAFYPAEEYHQQYLAKRGASSCHL
ncbi:MAG TPA: peptide-methionine (S)-S-oxide reductase MsrA [Fimbriimonas sp.]|nr:peptide-methionine (S)-S-oxide reductase MsrA [Fimbriimonas sp.]